MGAWARVVDGVVVEIYTPPAAYPDLTPDQVFPPSLPGTWVPCGTEVQPGWTWSDATGFAPPAPIVPPTAPVSQRQFQSWLGDNGKSNADVDTILATITDPADNTKMTAAYYYPDQNMYRYFDPVIDFLDNGGLFDGRDVEAVFREMMAYGRAELAQLSSKLTKRPIRPKRAFENATPRR